jgi:hypothetical protein
MNRTLEWMPIKNYGDEAYYYVIGALKNGQIIIDDYIKKRLVPYDLQAGDGPWPAVAHFEFEGNEYFILHIICTGNYAVVPYSALQPVPREVANLYKIRASLAAAIEDIDKALKGYGMKEPGRVPKRSFV